MKVLPCLLACLSLAGLANAQLLVDRGLPVENLNLTDLPLPNNRSNVAWGPFTTEASRIADTFTLSSPSRVTGLTLWVIASSDATYGLDLLSYADPSIYTLSLDFSFPSSLTAQVTGASSATEVFYVNGENLLSFVEGNFLKIYELYFDFSSAPLFLSGEIGFGLSALRPDGSNAFPFVHASSRGLSGPIQQDSSDDIFHWYQIGAGGSFDYAGFFNSGNFTGPYQNSSDLNVLVHGTVVVPEPAAISLAALVLLAGLILRRRIVSGRS